ncbi:MAG: Hsp20/alpha crystallin family protein [Bacteroidaceae bacterium]|nr:Hsp20/alpha crystallin family protein [Bacteroidales bacterium]MBP3670775.1 Hsp20/alpha crystallin family protein [Bacteroidaceae bacterium]MBQ2979657.1 Hsp20/alpha crystallin family protein [Bacteroidaceae bacterium]
MKTTRTYNNVFDALMGMMENEAWMSHTTGGALPAINIIDNNTQYEIEFAVPGMTKEDFGIQVDANNNLIVSMEKSPKASTEKRYLRQGFRASAFRQSIVLPEDINRDEISARVENGILYIVLPKLIPEVVKPEIRTIGIA